MRICSIDGCNKKYIAIGFCHTHYKRWQTHGDPLFTLMPRDRKCSIDGCNKKHSSLGYCSTHERRYRRYGTTLTYLKKYNSFIEAYEDQVIKNDDSCWGWKGSINNKGYGQVFCHGKIQFIHRFSFAYFKSKIPDGIQILHSCDNPLCSRVDHLFLGTQKDNMQDCIKKDRFKYVPNEKKAKGEQVGSAKLKETDVIEIKKMIKTGFKNTEIAALFNVTHKNISLIRNNKTWSHIP